MFIQTETTPNPAVLKFLPGRSVSVEGMSFGDPAAAAISPLAQRLFEIEGVVGVYFGEDFISVTKGPVEWHHIKPAILAAIMDHFVQETPLVYGEGGSGPSRHAEHAADDEDAEIIDQIKEILDQRVRPAVAQDGGDIVFHGFNRGVVYLNLRGACAGCPSSTATLKHGIETMLRHYVPEVTEVRAVG